MPSIKLYSSENAKKGTVIIYNNQKLGEKYAIVVTLLDSVCQLRPETAGKGDMSRPNRPYGLFPETPLPWCVKRPSSIGDTSRCKMACKRHRWPPPRTLQRCSGYILVLITKQTLWCPACKANTSSLSKGLRKPGGSYTDCPQVSLQERLWREHLHGPVFSR